jgi:soluble lytic murein transglycosylase
VPLRRPHPAGRPSSLRGRFREFTVLRVFLTAQLLVFSLAPLALSAAVDPGVKQQRQAFVAAWEAAGRGDHSLLEQALVDLDDYLLHPYLQYEDFRQRRAQIDDSEMSAFIGAHRQWAFTAGLETAWLRTLGKRGRWDSILAYGEASQDTEVRCHFANAKIRRGLTDGLLQVARSLWTVGKSQAKACDPVFAWLEKQGGISSGLAWERFSLALESRERKLARYLVRFMDTQDREWADRWLQQDRGGYGQLNQASRWPDTEKAHRITAYGLRRLARNDPDRAWEVFMLLDGRVSWTAVDRGGLIADLALWSAVGGSSETVLRMDSVPPDFLDDRLLEWWARFLLTQGDWAGVAGTITAMSPQLRDDSRWRYWEARALLESGRTEEGQAGLQSLALRANFYGFLAADRLDLPYAICPEDPHVDEAAITAFQEREGIDRALELHRAGLTDWARSEWMQSVRSLGGEGLRVAAAVANRQDWPDMAITALGNSGDLRWYEWRFPPDYTELAAKHAGNNGLDPSWVMGLMRSESALAEDAISHAGARGLMQVTPQTATQLARRHSFAYRGRSELLEADTNMQFGTAYLADLLDRFGDNPVLATGAYNAGPHVVDRWITDGYTGDPVVWIDTLPYFETRDYIPRVLAFSTIYEWRMGGPVKRISSRMPPVLTGGAPRVKTPAETAEIACSAD